MGKTGEVLWSLFWWPGFIAAWVIAYRRVGFSEIKAEHGVDWRQFLVPNLPWFALTVAKVWFWFITLAHWYLTGQSGPRWRAVVELDGRPVRRIVRLDPTPRAEETPAPQAVTTVAPMGVADGLAGSQPAAGAGPLPANYNDPLLDDASWLRAGESRYRALIPNHYGSPDTIAAGGVQRTQQDDPAAALFFFQKAIDTLHSNYCSFGLAPADWSRQPSDRDLGIVDAYLHALGQVRALRRGAPVNESVREVTHRLRVISTTFAQNGLDATPYYDRLASLAQLAPDVDVSDIFWDPPDPSWWR